MLLVPLCLSGVWGMLFCASVLNCVGNRIRQKVNGLLFAVLLRFPPKGTHYLQRYGMFFVFRSCFQSRSTLFFSVSWAAPPAKWAVQHSSSMALLFCCSALFQLLVLIIITCKIKRREKDSSTISMYCGCSLQAQGSSIDYWGFFLIVFFGRCVADIKTK